MRIALEESKNNERFAAMTRVALRLAFTADTPPPEITCAGCGTRELQSGIAVTPDAITTTYGESGEPMSAVDVRNAQPLCEACVKLLMIGQEG